MGSVLIKKPLISCVLEVKENMQGNTSKASAQALRPQIKPIKAKEGPDSAGGIPLNFFHLCGMMMKDDIRRSKY